eukprot:PhF_6_TR22359/c0_g1_i1/m.31687
MGKYPTATKVVQCTSLPGDVKSTAWSHKVDLQVTNCTPQPIQIQWVDYEGKVKREEADTIDPDDAWGQHSYVTHPFIIMDASGRDMFYFVVQDVLMEAGENVVPQVDLLVTGGGGGSAVKVESHNSVLKLSGGISSATSAVAKPQPAPVKPPKPTTTGLVQDHEYDAPKDVEGWRVFLHMDLYDNAEMVERLISTLREDLQKVRAVVPPHAVAKLTAIPFYFNACVTYLGNNGERIEGRGGCFHWSAGWLTSHGNSACKERTIEFYCADDYLDWRPSQPFVILHELTHAYHCLVHHGKDAFVQNAYTKAMGEGKYQKVAYVCTPNVTTRAYAATNAMEYVAELSEAYFGKND